MTTTRTTTRFTDRHGNPLWTLYGGRNASGNSTMKHHLTADSAADAWVNDCTDRKPEVEFVALCGTLVHHTIVGDSAAHIEPICRRCLHFAHLITTTA
jgi:hypothetical protein